MCLVQRRNKECLNPPPTSIRPFDPSSFRRANISCSFRSKEYNLFVLLFLTQLSSALFYNNRTICLNYKFYGSPRVLCFQVFPPFSTRGNLVWLEAISQPTGLCRIQNPSFAYVLHTVYTQLYIFNIVQDSNMSQTILVQGNNKNRNKIKIQLL